MKLYFLTILISLALVMTFGKTDATCKEALRYRDTPETHAEWEKWEGKYMCEY